MKHNINTFFICLLMAVSARAENNVDPVDFLLEKNREVLAAEKAYEAAVERVGVSGVLPDPMAESSLFLEPVETRNGPMQGQFMVGQRFPLWGKLKRERRVAELRAEIASSNLQETKIRVVFRMRKAWETYLKLKNSLDILDQYRDELETFRSIALTQYETGTGITQHPVLKLQIEISLTESQINDLQSDFESAVNDLQSLFDGSFSPDLFDNRRTEVLPNKPVEEWLETAGNVHPVYQKALREHQIAVLQHELAKRANYPDLTGGLTYTLIGDPEGEIPLPSPGSDAFGFRIGLNLPVWFGRNRARVESAELMVNSREETVADVWNQIEDEARTTNVEMDEVEETYGLYDERLFRESEQMLSSAFAAYETGRISFLDVLDSERMVIRVRLDFERIEAERRIASAQMLKSIGLIRLD